MGERNEAKCSAFKNPELIIRGLMVDRYLVLVQKLEANGSMEGSRSVTCGSQ